MTCLRPWNARSVVNKLTYVKSLFTAKSIDILCITETWLHNQIHDNDLVIQCIEETEELKEVLIVVSKKIRSKLILSHTNVEIITIELFLSPRNIFLSCVYVPPNPCHLYHLILFDYINSQCSAHNSDVILVGDFNAPDINWSSLNSSSHTSHCLCSCIVNNYLVQLVSNSTHVCGNILDLIFSNSPDRLSIPCIDTLNRSSSDHFLISVNLNSYSAKQSNGTDLKHSYMYAQADYVAINDHLLENLKSFSTRTPSVNETWHTIKQCILQTRDTLIPKFIIVTKQNSARKTSVRDQTST